MTGVPHPKKGHFPKHGPSAHFSNGSGAMADLLHLNCKATLLNQEEGVGDLVLFNQNSTPRRPEKLWVEQFLMGLEQSPQPAVGWFRHLCCGIHAGQVTPFILIGMGLIP